jgi:nitrite reductase/ring-hydroxylating ferredoxin subunit
MSSTDRFREVVPVDELEREGRVQTAVDGRSLAIFHHEGEIRVVDNRCPHMGFPLSEGSVEDGVLTCHWHHARFELSCGDTFDPWADDVRTFPVEVRDGSVYVDPHPDSDEPPAERWAGRLEDGLEQNLRLVVAKSAIGLVDAGVSADEITERGVRFGARYRESGWGPGLTILAAMRNVRQVLKQNLFYCFPANLPGSSLLPPKS